MSTDKGFENLVTILKATNKSLSNSLGTGAVAVMKQAGNVASSMIFPDLPSGKTTEEALEIVAEGIKSLGSFGEVNLVGAEENEYNINFHSCIFSTLLTGEMQCGKSAFCYFGFGLVEESIKRMTGKRCRITFNSRNDASDICDETIKFFD